MLLDRHDENCTQASHALPDRYILGMAGAAQFEASFYSHMRPHLETEATRGVYAKVDPESRNSLIMPVDISDSVTAFCDHRTEDAGGRAESQMRNLARLHGTAIATRQCEPSTLHDLARLYPAQPELRA